MLSTTAMAADETISGFYDIGTATDVVITPYVGETAVEVAEKNIDSDEAMENVYAGSDRLSVTYGGAVANEHYGVIMVEGSGLPTKDTEIYYINQETTASASVAFNVYPKLPTETKGLHAFRHTFATKLINGTKCADGSIKTLNIKAVADILGHTTTEITERYYVKKDTSRLTGITDGFEI